MKRVTIAVFKRDLPLLLAEVARGASVLLQKGRRRETVAILSPPPRPARKSRPLGLLAKRGKPHFRDWTITDHEMLAPPQSWNGPSTPTR